MAKKLINLILILFAAGLPLNSFAEAKKTIPFLDSELTQPVALVMVFVIVLLLCVIAAMSKVLFYAIDTYKKRNQSGPKNTLSILFVIGATLLTSQVNAQNDPVQEAVVAGPGLIGGLSPTSFYLLFGIILLEVIIILIMVGMFRFLAGLEKVKHAKAPKKKFAWFERLNNTKSVDAASEAEIDLGHEYDGIKELDNPTPPWWQWGFILSVVFGVVYLYVYQIGKTAPSQLEELAIANKKAEAKIKEYLAVAGNMVDETTVEALTEAGDLAAGQNVFITACAACHANDGGGTVGPNLTDDYWLHGGSIKDIFKTVKYGVPEKGMKSWKDDYSPKQIAQVSSYILTLRGTQPASPKEPQGELYTPESAETPATEGGGDSTRVEDGAVAWQ